MKKVLSLIACIGLSLALNAQNKKVFGTKDGELIHESSESYEWPTDAKVLEKLDKWQDVKFGIMYHWGIYSVPEGYSWNHSPGWSSNSSALVKQKEEFPFSPPMTGCGQGCANSR